MDKLMTYKTREEYLQAAVEKMKPWFEAVRNPLSDHVYVSVGFSPKNPLNALGICFPPHDLKKAHVFVSPLINEDTFVLSTLLHELCHSVLPSKAGHGKEFAELAGNLGFVPPWKFTPMGDQLLEKIKKLSNELGIYPHEQLFLEEKPKKDRVKNIVKVKCKDCDLEVKINRKFLDNPGPPICPNHSKMSVLE